MRVSAKENYEWALEILCQGKRSHKTQSPYCLCIVILSATDDMPRYADTICWWLFWSFTVWRIIRRKFQCSHPIRTLWVYPEAICAVKSVGHNRNDEEGLCGNPRMAERLGIILTVLEADTNVTLAGYLSEQMLSGLYSQYIIVGVLKWYVLSGTECKPSDGLCKLWYITKDATKTVILKVLQLIYKLSTKYHPSVTSYQARLNFHSFSYSLTFLGIELRNCLSLRKLHHHLTILHYWI